MKKFLLISFIALFLSGCNIQAPNKKVFSVSGDSMVPNYLAGEYWQIDDPLETYERGDVVVFKYPKDESEVFMKRIIGLPNETVQISEGLVYINGQLLDESYLLSDVSTKGNMTAVLKDSEYWVMGDNRDFSLDSRSFGPLDKKFITGLITTKLE